MRTAVNGGLLLLTLLLLLATTAFVGFRRPREAPAPPAFPPAAKPLKAVPPRGLWRPDHPPDGVEPASPSPASPDGTRLAFEQTDVDLGTIEPSEGRVLRFPWRRTGVGAITVRRITTGCGCAVAEGLPEVVPPGEAGTMLVRLAGRTRLGPFTVWVRILTDRPPPDDLVRLRVRGFVGRSIAVLPESIDLGPVVPGFAKTLYVSVRPPSGVTVDRVLARLDAIEGTTSVGLPAEADAVGRDVRVSLVAPRATGPFEGALDLVLGDAGLWHVPIRGTVVTPVAGVRR